MSDQSYATLDVRPILRAGGEPFSAIMQSVARLRPGEGLRLLATFEPIPLFKVLGAKGFGHDAHRIEDGDWEVLFTPAAEPAVSPAASDAPAAPTGADGWPAPSAKLDNRGLEPPEPMIRILQTLEHMASGEVLEVFNDREPVLLYPELKERGHPIKVERQGNFYRLLIRHSVGSAA
ncbi:MAG TPA: DUF2249 domain-containing protein [Stellaceae bacterium]|nr:DUF2249 domain-containing protein [Stellaceae bacterium]